MKKLEPDMNSKSNSEIPEVLVLPPSTLLDKFGISLGDIGKFLDVRKSCNEDAPLHAAHEKCGKSDISDTRGGSPYIDLNESSIMKTANLMKKSVFLSPTFTNSRLADSSMSEVLPSSASAVVSSNTENDGGQELIRQNDSEILSKKNKTKKEIHEKLYQYTKKQSEVDMKTISITNNNKYVSEEVDVIDNSIKILKSSSNTNLSIDSVKLLHKKSLPLDDGEDVHRQINSSNEKEVKNNECTKFLQINTKLEGEECPNYAIKFNTESKLKKLYNQVIKERIHNGIIVENKIHTQSKEQSSIMCPVPPNTNTQGVEKPGGDRVFDFLKLNKEENPKIYRIKGTLKVAKENKTSDFFGTTTADNIDVVDSCKGNIVKDFCVCSDFGSFHHYSREYNEHIHYWKRTNINCSNNVIFSIYYDDDDNSVGDNNYSFEDDEMESGYICIDDNNDIDYELVSNVNEEERTMEPTLIDTAVPVICFNSQHEKGNQSNGSNSNGAIRLYEVEMNEASNELEMQTTADNPTISLQKQRSKRKLKRNRNEDSPESKKARIDCGSTGEYSESGDITNSKDSQDGLPQIIKKVSSTTEKSHVICAVCHQSVSVSEWYEHIAKKHNYLAWKEGDAILDVKNGEVVREHLIKMLQKFGVLLCSRCGVERSEASKYLSHVNSCERLAGQSGGSPPAKAAVRVKCGACQAQVTDWNDHVGSAHNYLACKEGDPPVDFDNEEAVREHLSVFLKECDGLICSKCGCRRKFIKSYLKHIRMCDIEPSCDNLVCAVKCGVCRKEMKEGDWIKHIEEEHDYLAWESKEEPINLKDPEAVNRHLYKILKQMNYLVCTNCGSRWKQVKRYLTHVSQCTATSGYSANDQKVAPVRKRLSKVDLLVEDESATVTCGVCGLVKAESEWLKHIEKEHDYMAWKFGDPPIELNSMRSINLHLRNILKYYTNGFSCSKCGEREMMVRVFMKHRKSCTGGLQIATKNGKNTKVDDSNLDHGGNVRCGVCKKSIEGKWWIKHIEEEHFYLAKKDTEEMLDLDDAEMCRNYLYTIVQKLGHLTCNKCGIKRKYAKTFLDHISECISNVDVDVDETTDSSIQVECTNTDIIKCGVCEKEIEYTKWEVHLQLHQYIAWKEGETPLDSSDEQVINAHLYDMSKKYKGLTCGKCNTTKKYVKSYMNHITSCNNNHVDVAVTEHQANKDAYECAICHENGPTKEFKSHAMNKHYNVAWMVGDIPIDVRSMSAVEKPLKEYLKCKGTLRCRKCNSTRASLAGFFAHVIQCGTTEEVQDMYKSVCEICNAKYLGVYKHPHMAIHRAEIAKKRLSSSKNTEANDTPDVNITLGKRRAAQKAEYVIKNITEVDKGTEDSADDEADFKCPEESSSSESDDSGEMETEEVGGASGTDVDSDLADTETRVRHRKPGVTSFNVSNGKRIPFCVKDPDVYMAKTLKEFTEMQFSSTTLFPEWLTCEYESVADDELPKYMPPLKDSCQVKFCSNPTTTYRLFEARCYKDVPGLSLFVGASIQGMSWAPSCGKQAYLAVNCHNGTDAPRVNVTEILEHPGLIQIWDFKDMQQSPSFAFGIAHELGTIWGMDWCPSGACEVLEKDTLASFVRMGLLAVACSNGSVCIFSVPHPSSVTRKDRVVFKLKPVAELRLFRNTARKVQATAISWSMQKGHACIAVGYGNGMTAKYDLACDSPLLTCVEDGVKVFYPFHDERPHTACITDVKTFACGAELCGAASTSPCGAMATLANGRVHLPLTAERLLLAPHWPSVLLAGNTDIITQAINEVDWWGQGRRLGSMSSGCGCLVCGRMAAFFPPLLKTMSLHPVCNDDRDSQVMAKIDIMCLRRAETSQLDSNQSAEPRIYEEMVQLYGIQFHLGADLKRKDIYRNMNQPKQRNAERYPLADITCMAFCPIVKHHSQLAIATFGGIIFVINT